MLTYYQTLFPHTAVFTVSYVNPVLSYLSMFLYSVIVRNIGAGELREVHLSVELQASWLQIFGSFDCRDRWTDIKRSL